MSAFTPGPWTVGEWPSEDASDYFSIGTPDACVVVSYKDGDDIVSGICGRPNANLISAAPSMYDALKLVLADAAANGGFITAATASSAICALNKAESGKDWPTP